MPEERFINRLDRRQRFGRFANTDLYYLPGREEIPEKGAHGGVRQDHPLFRVAKRIKAVQWLADHDG